METLEPAYQISKIITDVPTLALRGSVPYDTYVQEGYTMWNHYSAIMQPDYNTLKDQENLLSLNVNNNAKVSYEQANIATTKAQEASESAEIARDTANFEGEWIANAHSGIGYSQSASVSYFDNIYLSKLADNLVEPTLEESSINWFFTGRKKIEYSTRNSDYIAKNLDYLNIDSSLNGFTITLPTTHFLNDIIIINTSSTVELNNVIVIGNGSNILFQNELDVNLVLDKNGIELKLKSNGTDWRVL